MASMLTMENNHFQNLSMQPKVSSGRSAGNRANKE
jgi:hypothetical protein